MNDFAAGVRDYFDTLRTALAEVHVAEIVETAEVLRAAYDQQRTILVLGNGGSAATASHMVCDFNKDACFHAEKKFRLIALTDSSPLLLALGNDAGFESVFVEQVKCYARPGDVVIGISGSGNSPNVLRAMEYAKQIGCVTIGVCGFDGGKLKPLVDHCFHVRADDMQIVQDVHMAWVHVLSQILGVGRRC